MSLITQCPACSTMFKVVPDQLRISEGWVRCGHCDEVFDANAHLQTLDQPHAKPPPDPPVSATTQETPAVPAAEPSQHATEPAYDWGALLEPSLPLTATGDARQGDPLELGARADEQSPDVLLPMDTPVQDSGPDIGDERALFEPSDPVGQDAIEESIREPEEVPSFMPRNSRRSWVDRYLGNGFTGAICLLLALVLALQYVLLQRDLLAASTPALRPGLAAACALLGCNLSAPQQIESIAIESSAFTSVKPGVYTLRLSLRNAAAFDLSAPALELTLTDMQDLALMRRVLLPAEYSGKGVIAAGTELLAKLPLMVPAGNAPEKIAGYKLLAFYP